MPATFHLICGSTGAGKTTYAMALARRLNAARFSIDEWMATLFWMDTPQPIQYAWTIERVERCERQILDTALILARLGTSSILDLGLVRADHRARVADLAEANGIAVSLHAVEPPAEVRWSRVCKRNAERGETFCLEVTREMFDLMESIWQPPTQAEMIAWSGIRVDN